MSEQAGLPSELIRDLQESGLVDFATQGFLDPYLFADEIASCLGYSPSATHGYDGYGDNGKGKRQKLCHGSNQALQRESVEINQAADRAVARASRALNNTLSKLKPLLLSNLSLGRKSSSLADLHKAKRKASRTSTESCSGRVTNKGLRHFSMRVCSKVESKGRTTYNEVADELVTELSRDSSTGDDIVQYDEKNIRRRVYDAINVLMAMGAIEKEKKEIIWKGFPNGNCLSLESCSRERQQLVAAIENKASYLQELIEQQQALKSLLAKNQERSPDSCGTALHLPFVLVQAKPDATVEVTISDDMLDVQFDLYNSPFQIHDDSYVLKNLVMAKKTAELQSSLDTVSQGLSAAGACRTDTSVEYTAFSSKSDLIAQHSATLTVSPQMHSEDYLYA